MEHVCSIPGCGGKVLARTWCQRHYSRWYRTGDPLIVRKPPSGPKANRWEPVEPRFWAKVDRRGPDECWLWTGSRRHAYGEIFVRGKKSYAHRVSYELACGPIPEGLLVRHQCDTPLCVNPAHLDVGTQLDNMRDASERGRWRNQYASGLSGKQRKVIRRKWREDVA